MFSLSLENINEKKHNYRQLVHEILLVEAASVDEFVVDEDARVAGNYVPLLFATAAAGGRSCRGSQIDEELAGGQTLDALEIESDAVAARLHVALLHAPQAIEGGERLDAARSVVHIGGLGTREHAADEALVASELGSERPVIALLLLLLLGANSHHVDAKLAPDLSRVVAQTGGDDDVVAGV